MNMGERIRQLREEKDMSQEELGKLVGVQRAAVQKWENGQTKNLKADVIKTLSDFFGVNPSYLMDMSDIKSAVPYKTKSVPMLGTVAAGEPIFCHEETGVFISMNDEKVDFCLRVQGDSMTDARINDGDVVFVRRQSEVENGDVAVVLVGEDVTLKRFYKNGDIIVLKPENSSYEPMVFTEENSESLRILGKAMFCQRRI